MEDLIHGLLKLGRDELAHEILTNHLLLSVAGDLGGLAVPLVDEAVCIDAEDGRVRRVNEQGEIVRDALHLALAAADLCDVLTDTDVHRRRRRSSPPRSDVLRH